MDNISAMTVPGQDSGMEEVQQQEAPQIKTSIGQFQEAYDFYGTSYLNEEGTMDTMRVGAKLKDKPKTLGKFVSKYSKDNNLTHEEASAKFGVDKSWALGTTMEEVGKGVVDQSKKLAAGSIFAARDLGKSLGYEPSEFDNKIDTFDRELALKAATDSDNRYKYLGGLQGSFNDDGSFDSPWYMAHTVGQMLPEIAVALGTTSKAMITPAKSVMADTAIGMAAAGAEYKVDGRDDSLAMNIGASIFGGAIGQYLLKTPMIPNTGKNAVELDKQLDALHMLEKFSKEGKIKMPNKAISNVEVLETLLKSEVNNPMVNKEVAEAMNSISVPMLRELDKTAKMLGTDISKLMKYKKGDISLNEMGSMFQKTMKEEAYNYGRQASKYYNLTKEMDLDVNNLPIKHNTGDLFNQAVFETKDSPAATNVIHRAFAQIQKADDPMVKQATELRGTYDDILDRTKEASSSLVNSQNQLNLEKMRLNDLMYKQADGKDVETAIAVAEEKIRKYTINVEGAATASKELASEKGKALNQLKGFKGMVNDNLEIDPILTAKDLERVDYSQLSSQELHSISKYIRKKARVAGGNISLDDHATIGALDRADTQIRSLMKEKASPEFMEALKQGDAITVKKYQILGKDGPVQNMYKALEEGASGEQFMKLFQGDIGVKNLKALKAMDNGKFSPEYNDIVNRTYFDKMMDGARSETMAGDAVGFDFKQVQKNLNKLDINEITELAGAEAGTQWRSIKTIVNVYGEGLNEVAKVKGRVMGKEFANDSLNKLGNFLKYLPKNLARGAEEMVVDPIRKATGSHKRAKWYKQGTDFSADIESTLKEIKNLKGEGKLNRLEKLMDKLGKQGGKMRGAHLTPFKPAEEVGINVGSHVTRLLDENPDMKLSGTQLTGWLKKQGVSPYEMNRLDIDGVDTVKSLDEWKGYFSKYNKDVHISRPIEGANLGIRTKYNEYTYKKEGTNMPGANYREIALMNHQIGPRKTGMHTVAGVKDNLGWRRQHDSTINGEKGIILDEIQSDTIQRSSKFPSNLGYDVKPTSEKKFQIGQIASALDDSIKDGTNTVFIPIERSGDLVGNDAVTKKYMKLNDPKGPIQTLKKKLESQGYKLDVEKVVDGVKNPTSSGLGSSVAYKYSKVKGILEEGRDLPSELGDSLMDVLDNIEYDKDFKFNIDKALKFLKENTDTESYYDADLYGPLHNAIESMLEVEEAGKELWKLKVTPNSKVKKPRIDLLGIGAGGVGVAEAFRQNSERKDNGNR